MHIIFNKTKFVHTVEMFKKQKILNTSLIILSNIIFMHLVEYKTAPSIFLTKAFPRLSSKFFGSQLFSNYLEIKKKQV